MAHPDAPLVTLDLLIEIPWPSQPPDLEDRCQALLAATLARVGLTGAYEISLVLTGDRQIQRLNRDFRGIDQATDVLSFPQSDAPLLDLAPDEAWVARPIGDDTHHAPWPDSPTPRNDAVVSSVISEDDHVTPPGMPYHLGDIMLAIPTVERQARAAGHSAWWECAFLLVHGALHLIGYDDYYEPGYHAMVAHQEAVLRAGAIRLHE